MAHQAFGNNFASLTNTGDWYGQYVDSVTTATATAGTAVMYPGQMANAWALQQMQMPYPSAPAGEDGETTLKKIKSAIHVIKDETVSDEAKTHVESRAQKYRRAGFNRQADILEAELRARIRLARIKEWDYKVLPYKAIKDFDGKTINKWTYHVHIEPVEKYLGIPEGTIVEGEFDKIVPEHVVDSLLTAQDRQIFDEYSVLWVEKVKDPLLLGRIKELPDYFLIDEWGDDIKFSDIVKASKKK
jgi:hypothetical protein